MDIKELMQYDLNEILSSIAITESLRKNIKSFLLIHKISKEDVQEICGLTLSQYYRRMNNPFLYTDSDLANILRYCLSKK